MSLHLSICKVRGELLLTGSGGEGAGSAGGGGRGVGRGGGSRGGGTSGTGAGGRSSGGSCALAAASSSSTSQWELKTVVGHVGAVDDLESIGPAGQVGWRSPDEGSTGLAGYQSESS
jgi:hypothetical protein